MNKYIDGERDEIPINESPLPMEIKDIFYLLAHFYYCKLKSWVSCKVQYIITVLQNYI